MSCVRLLHKNRLATVQRVMEEMGTDSVDTGMVEPRTVGFTVQVSQVERPAIDILRQRMLLDGGEVVVVPNGAERTDVLLTGDPRQFRGLVDQISGQPFGLGRIAEDLKAVLAVQTMPFDLDCGSGILHLSERTHIMGILNVTPDSFFDGGRHFSQERAVERGLQMVDEGADIVDVGGESTRPGADPVSVSEEMERVVPVIRGIRSKTTVPISIDTRKSEVVKAAVEAGANLVNDVSGLRFDPRMASVVANAGVPVVVMHMRGSPKDMQKNPVYDNLMGEIYDFLDQRIQTALEAGIPREKIVVDPGIGFGKKYEDNFVILRRLEAFQGLGCPLLVGVSRKSFIGWALNQREEERLLGTAAAVAASVLRGAHIVRVHDVKEMVQVVRICDYVNRKRDRNVG